MVKVKIPNYFTSVVRNAHDLTKKPEAVFWVYKLLKATRQGKKDL